jgi:OOP family OmpA-OmpF porin
MSMNKSLLLFAFFLSLAKISVGQESQQQTGPAAPQWSNRDMTYRGKNYDIMDSAYYPKFRATQFRKYMEHQEAFPPKPRNMWEVGLGLGIYNVIGEIPTRLFGGGGFNLNVRKALGYMFSMRLQYMYGVAKNLDGQQTFNYEAPYTQLGYTPAYATTAPNLADSVYRYSRTESSMLSLDFIFNLHNISFHRAKTTVSFFGYFGLGGLGYKTRMNALKSDYGKYAFGSLATPTDKKSKIRKDLRSKMDDSWETAAPDNAGAHILDNKVFDFAPSVGAGVQFRINKQFNFQIEERYTFPKDGYIDGTRMGTPLGNQVATGGSDALNYFSIGLNYNVKVKKKAVEPLWWINPLDHGYNELSYPRHMILPNPVLPDEDGDGVTDQFDKCPKTPKGVAVDGKGCPLDTDGDGVPDYKDKQLITPTECQPVDADGVGHCPCPDDCQGKLTGGGKDKCGNINAGALIFNDGKQITNSMQAQLATLAAQMQANPDCKVVILGGGSGSKVKEQRSWEHVNAVIEHMSEKNNISRERFIFKYGEAGDENTVTFRAASMDESGPVNVPPPHPNIR